MTNPPDKLWTLDVVVHGATRRHEEFGDTVNEACWNAATRFGVSITAVTAVVGPDGQHVWRVDAPLIDVAASDDAETLDMPADGDD